LNTIFDLRVFADGHLIFDSDKRLVGGDGKFALTFNPLPQERSWDGVFRACNVI
jgi:hypothetical protein